MTKLSLGCLCWLHASRRTNIIVFPRIVLWTLGGNIFLLEFQPARCEPGTITLFTTGRELVRNEAMLELEKF